MMAAGAKRPATWRPGPASLQRRCRRFQAWWRCSANTSGSRSRSDHGGRGETESASRVARVRLQDAALRGKLARMATPITVNIPHQLGRVEARQRIESGFATIVRQLPGGAGSCSERWEGDRLVFSVVTMGQTIAGVIDVLDTSITMEIELPGVLGIIAGGLKGRLLKQGQRLLAR